MEARRRHFENQIRDAWHDLGQRNSHDSLGLLYKSTVAFLAGIPQKSLSEFISQASKRSHVHDNGFEKLHLFDTSCGMYRLRIHKWGHGQTSRVDANVHEHRYDFSSLVLVGKLENIRWQREADGKEFKSFLYRPCDESRDYRMIRMGRERLNPNPPEQLDPGSSYSMQRDELHIVRIPNEEQCITFCLQNRERLKAEAWTYSLGHPDNLDMVPVKSMTSESYVTALRSTMEDFVFLSSA